MRLQNSFKAKLRYFARESVRRRTRGEYGEIFLRGTAEKDGGVPSVPWLYLRVLAVGIIIFSVSVLAYRLTHSSIDLLTAILYGAIPFNAAVLVFFYELYPERDLNIFLLIFVAFAGGAVACAGITLGYQYIYDDPFMQNPWVSLLWTGFWEELIKGAVAVSAVAVLKKKNPFCCFLVGFAVGSGFSFLEDMSYIYSYARGYGTNWLVLMPIGRGLSCAFSHAPWTGIICFAYAKFKRPFLNFRFYGTVLAVMILHYLADVPFFAEEVAFLQGLNFGWLMEAFVVVAIVLLQYFALKSCYKKQPEQTEIPLHSETPVAEKYAHAANVTGLVCSLALSAVILIGCALNIGNTWKYVEFHTDGEFISYMQGGRSFIADWTREYDVNSGDYFQYFFEGVKKRAVQREADGDIEYFYFYELDEEGNFRLNNIGVKVGGEVLYCNRIIVYEDNYLERRNIIPAIDYIPVDKEESVPDDPSEPENPDNPIVLPEPLRIIDYFSGSYRNFTLNLETQTFKVRTDELYFNGLAAAITLGSLFASTALGGAVAVIILKKKSRSYKNEG